MRTGLIAKALSRRFDFTRLTAAALARIARSPSYRAPSARDLHNPATFHPPTEHSPLEAFGARDLVIRDGAVVGLSLSGRSFISNGAALVRKVPLREVRLVAVQPFMAELARCQHLAGLRRLDLSGNRIGVGGMRELANSPYLGELRELNLSGNDLGPEGVQWLARAPWFANLERLEAADNGIGASELNAFLPAAANLVHLDLARNLLGRTGGPALAGWPGAASLESLAASGCGLGPDGTSDLLRGDFRSLLRLDLSFNRIGPDIAVTLPPALAGLDLSFNDLGDGGIAALTASPPPALTSLNLAANRISRAGLRRLAESGWLDSIAGVNLDINPNTE
jgi:Leucine-rich repeat (LRR) protein